CGQSSCEHLENHAINGFNKNFTPRQRRLTAANGQNRLYGQATNRAPVVLCLRAEGPIRTGKSRSRSRSACRASPTECAFVFAHSQMARAYLQRGVPTLTSFVRCRSRKVLRTPQFSRSRRRNLAG